jgi:nucleotide-binding universal stress UspA family protein
MERILIAIDGSPASHEAVEFGVELAAEQNAAVTFVHVVRAVDVIPTTCFGMGAGARPHEVTDEERQPLVEAKAVAEQRGVRATAKLLVGDAVDEIVACADNLDVDLIVIGSRGHGTLTSALLGSVSRGVVSESKRPVLIIRGLEPAQSEASRLSVEQGGQR